MFTLDESRIQSSDTRLDSRNQTEFKIITWNVWFGSHLFEERMNAVVDISLREQPDILCFQEVTPDFANALRSSAHLNEVFEISENEVAAYGVILMARRLSSILWIFSETRLPSNQGRSLLTVSTHEPSFVVATVHLESLDSRKTREVQLAQSSELLQEFSTSVLCGDFNFDATRTYGDWDRPANSPLNTYANLENTGMRHILDSYVDAWAEINPSDPGYTFNGKRNPMVRDAKEVMRYDRIMVRHAVVEEVRLIGTEPLQHVGAGKVYPSDHYGLVALVRIPPSTYVNSTFLETTDDVPQSNVLQALQIQDVFVSVGVFSGILLVLFCLFQYVRKSRRKPKIGESLL